MSSIHACAPEPFVCANPRGVVTSSRIPLVWATACRLVQASQLVALWLGSSQV